MSTSSTAKQAADTVQTQVLDMVDYAQGVALDLIRTWATPVRSFVPESAHEFATDLVESQQKFVKDVLAAVAPKADASTN